MERRSSFGSPCNCKCSSFRDLLPPRTSHSRSDSVHRFSCSFLPAAALAHRTRPSVAGPERCARKRIGLAKAAAAQDRLIALVKRGIAAVFVDALAGIGRAPARPRRLAPLRARPALGINVGEQQNHYCDTEQNKTDRAHGSSPSSLFFEGQCKRRGGVAAEQSTELAPLHLDDPRAMRV